jgi:hypothetical protein
VSAITKTSARDSSPQPMRSGAATPTAVDSVESTDRTRNRGAHVAAYLPSAVSSGTYEVVDECCTEARATLVADLL